MNGKALDASASPGSYLAISRTWNNGDRVEMDLPMRLRIQAMPDDHICKRCCTVRWYWRATFPRMV